MHQTNKINNLKILNSRETKEIVQILKSQYQSDLDLSEYVFLINKDNKIYLASRNIELLPYDEMKIDSLGIYFGEIYKESLRLSIEGSQLVGPVAKDNVIELSRDQMLAWVKGADIEILDEEILEKYNSNKHFIITKYDDGKSIEYFGAGKVKDGKILNMVSKSRRLVVVNE
jgi:NOL1/NOP2/fmu family ribosome biogenesis protein